jgi:hypothetical protein
VGSGEPGRSRTVTPTDRWMSRPFCRGGHHYSGIGSLGPAAVRSPFNKIGSLRTASAADSCKTRKMARRMKRASSTTIGRCAGEQVQRCVRLIVAVDLGVAGLVHRLHQGLKFIGTCLGLRISSTDEVKKGLAVPGRAQRLGGCVVKVENQGQYDSSRKSMTKRLDMLGVADYIPCVEKQGR